MQSLIRQSPLDGQTEGVQKKAWILVIHYSFSESETLSDRTPGNDQDLQLLQTLFDGYQDCIYRHIASPRSSEIGATLSSDGIKSLFKDDSDGPPSVFMLFVFSHGDENGVICTDQNSTPIVYFTIYDVFDALSKNLFLENCLKINIFGSCRGSLPELAMPPTEKLTKESVGKNSTSILGQPNKYNFINLFSTVESTMSYTNRTKGSFLVVALEQQLRALEKDVDVVELMRRVQDDVIKNYSANDRQTPQISVFPHRPTQFCSRLFVENPISQNGLVGKSNLITVDRCAFYPWSSPNMVFRRGPALIFSQNQSQLATQFDVTLKQLEFSPVLCNLLEIEETLKNASLNGLLSNEGCLFVVVIAPIEGVEEKSTTGMTVALGGAAPVPIGHLTRNFVTSRCTAFAEKPKVFIFIDPEVTSNMKVLPIGVLKLEQVPIGNNHSGFLVFIGFGEEVAHHLLEHLRSPDLKTGNSSLQEKLSVLQTKQARRSSQRMSQIWSTMPLKLDFPRCRDSYVPHSFFLYGEGSVNFGRLVHMVKKGNHKVVLITAPPGMGKSRASEEIYSRLVLGMSSNAVLYVKLSQLTDFWIKYAKKSCEPPSVKSFLLRCVDESKFLEMQQRVDEGRMVAVLDGFDEIAPHYRSIVISLINELLAKSTKVLITSRPQEKYRIIKDLQQEERDLISFDIGFFQTYQKLLMLQTRLGKDEDSCREILARFKNLSYDFTDNPLHLQLISETEEMETLDLIALYKQFLAKKIKHGLLTCRQIEEISSEFTIKITRILSILTMCAVALVVDRNVKVISLENREVMDINHSGVATVESNKAILSLNFVSQTFAEFLTAQHFMQMCFEPPLDEDLDVVTVELDVQKLFNVGVSYQTMSFIEEFIDKRYQGRLVNDDVMETISKVKKDVFECICRAGMGTLFDILWGRLFDGPMVQQWMVESHLAAEYKEKNIENSVGFYFHACCSNLQLAAKLSKWCPILPLDDVESLVKCLSNLSRSRHSLEQALSKVADWNSKWPKADFFTKNSHGSFSSEYYEFAFENCLDVDGASLLQIVYSRNFNLSYTTDILPLLLRLGLDLTYEVDGVRVLNMFFESDLFHLAVHVAKHFKNTHDLNSKESQQLMKNVGAKTPQQLGLTEDERGLYLEHILERACALFDPGTCGPSQSMIATDAQEYEMSQLVRWDANLRPIATHFKLCLMRKCVSSDEQDTLRIFKGEKNFIKRDFVYNCGCTLVHDACSRSDAALLEALIQNEFPLLETNKKGETPLHKSVLWGTDCTHVLLKRFLGPLFDDCGAARTPDDQAKVERTLGQRDLQGRNPFLAAALSSIDEGNAQLLMEHLLGPMVLTLDATRLVRPDAVQTILCDSDLQGSTALHGAVLSDKKLTFLRLLLKNLLGALFLEGRVQTDAVRTLQLQKRIAQLLQPRNHEGHTPLCNSVCDFSKYQVHELLLRNVLGDYFVEADGATAKPFDDRSPEENEFVSDVLLTSDAPSPYALCKSRRCDENVQRLIEANAGYLLHQSN